MASPKDKTEEVVSSPPSGLEPKTGPEQQPTTTGIEESAAEILASGAVIEADDYADTHEPSNYGSDVASETTSIKSSVRDYIYENGRRYHRYGGPGKYILPNDETEQDRLDLMHHILLMALGGDLHMAPVKNPHNVLDCGTGTGIWALDFGDQHPESTVTGVDLSPIQPGWVAPNVRFEVDDLEKDWTWAENKFDFVHIRSICNGSDSLTNSLIATVLTFQLGGIRDYQRLVEQAFCHTKPGGWTELSEFSFDIHSKDGTMTDDTAIGKYVKIVTEAYEKLGIVFPRASMMQECMKKAGFVDIVAKTLHIPWGPWPKNSKLKELGAYFSLTGTGGFEAYGLAALTRGLGMDEVEAKKICHDAYNDLANRNIHVVGPVHYVYGRKPE